MKNRKPNALLLGKALVEGRKRLGITQRQVAEILCVSNKAVSKWECGRGLPDVSLYPEIEKLFGFSVYEFCAEEELPEESFSAQNPIEPETRKKRKAWVNAVIALAALIIIGGAVGLSLFLSSPSETPPPVEYDVKGEGEYLFEAENAELSSDLIIWNDAGSGSGYVGNFDFHDGVSMRFTFFSDGVYTARLYFCLVTRGIDDLCNKTYTVTFNGDAVYSRAVFRGRYTTLTAFSEYYIADVSLQTGENELLIVFNANESDNNGHNFDYIKLNTRLTETSDYVLEAEESEFDRLTVYYNAGSGLGHLGGFDQSDGAKMTFRFSVKEQGSYAMFFCINPRGINDAINETYEITLNGIPLSSNGVIYGEFHSSNWLDFKEYFVNVINCSAEENVLEIVYHSNRAAGKDSTNGHNFDYVRLIPYASLGQYEGGEQILEAEDTVFDPRLSVLTGNGRTFLGNFDGSDGATVSFLFHASADARVALVASLVPRGLEEFMTDSFEIRINGKLIASDTVISGMLDSDWMNFVEYTVGYIDIMEGINEIQFSFKWNQLGNNGHNFDYIKLIEAED